MYFRLRAGCYPREPLIFFLFNATWTSFVSGRGSHWESDITDCLLIGSQHVPLGVNVMLPTARAGPTFIPRSITYPSDITCFGAPPPVSPPTECCPWCPTLRSYVPKPFSVLAARFSQRWAKATFLFFLESSQLSSNGQWSLRWSVCSIVERRALKLFFSKTTLETAGMSPIMPTPTPQA